VGKSELGETGVLSQIDWREEENGKKILRWRATYDARADDGCRNKLEIEKVGGIHWRRRGKKKT